MAKNIKILILSIIILLGSFLYLYKVESYPVSFNSQEALLGWRAKSILEVGKDELGRRYPLIFSSMVGYQLPMPTYFLIPSIKIFGLNEFGVRFPFALLSLLGLFAFYGIVRNLYPHNEGMAVGSLFVLIVSPGLIYLSRISNSMILAFSFFLLGLFFLLKGSVKKYSIILSVIFFTFSIYSSKTAWFMLPLLFLWYLLDRKKEILIIFISLLLLFAPLLFSYFSSPQVKVDLLNNDFSLLGDVIITGNINMMRGEDLISGTGILGKLFYNKIFYSVKILENFLRYFNPRSYFSVGDENPLHGIVNFGPLLVGFLPLFLLGLKSFVDNSKRSFIFLCLWLFLGIIPSIFMIISPDQEKAIFILPILAIITSFSLINLKGRYLVLFLLILSINFSVVVYDALTKDSKLFLEKRNSGYKELALYLKEVSQNYKKVYLTDSYGSDPGPALLFYLNDSPAQFFKENSNNFGYRNFIKNVGNVSIDQKESWKKEDKTLFIVTPEETEIINKFNLEGQGVRLDKILKDYSGKEILLAFSVN